MNTESREQLEDRALRQDLGAPEALAEAYARTVDIRYAAAVGGSFLDGFTQVDPIALAKAEAFRAGRVARLNAEHRAKERGA